MQRIGLSITFWAIYSTDIDLPAVLSRLVGLGYVVAKAYFVNGKPMVDLLADGSLAYKSTNHGPIRMLYDNSRKAVGVFASNTDLALTGVTELYRSLRDANVPEPPITELSVSYEDSLTICGNRGFEFMNMKLEERGTVLMWGEPQGRNMYIVITPIAQGKSLVLIGVRGEWGLTTQVLKRLGDAFLEISKLNCKG